MDVRLVGSSGLLSRLDPGEIVAVLDLSTARPGSRLFNLRSDEVRVLYGDAAVASGAANTIGPDYKGFNAQAVLSALAVVVDRRSDQAWEAIALVAEGRTQADAATALGISRQAVGQRLSAGLWDLERELRPTAVRLLTRAAG